jgi:hypothetical protein
VLDEYQNAECMANMKKDHISETRTYLVQYQVQNAWKTLKNTMTQKHEVCSTIIS